MRHRAIMFVALTLASACVTSRALRTAPAPGTRVQVAFVKPRNLVVGVRGAGARDSVRFDSITVVTGRVARAEGDTVWLEDVYPERDGNALWPGDDSSLRIDDLGRGAVIRDASVSPVKTTALVLVSLIGVAVLTIGIIWFGVATGGPG